MKRELVSRAMEEFWMTLHQSWDMGIRECAGGSPSSSSSRYGHGNHSSTPLSSFGPRKRRKVDDEQENDKSGNPPGQPAPLLNQIVDSKSFLDSHVPSESIVDNCIVFTVIVFAQPLAGRIFLDSSILH